MRCTKCGYVSFDYLSECMKCGTNLAGIRDTFGFSASKPSIPFTVGSFSAAAQAPGEMFNPSAEAPSQSSFGFDEEFGGGFKIVADDPMDEKAEPVPTPDEGEEDFTLLDLSDEELELLIDKDPESAEASGAVEKEEGDWLELDEQRYVPDEVAKPAAHPDSAAPNPAALFKEAPAQEMAEQPEEKDRLLNIDFSSLPGLSGKASEPGVAIETPLADPKPSQAAAAGQAPVQAQDSEQIDDLVIELSEDDLESLMQDLNGHGKPKAEAVNGEAPGLSKSD